MRFRFTYLTHNKKTKIMGNPTFTEFLSDPEIQKLMPEADDLMGFLEGPPPSSIVLEQTAQSRPDPLDCVMSRRLPGRYQAEPVASFEFVPAVTGTMYLDTTNEDEPMSYIHHKDAPDKTPPLKSVRVLAIVDPFPELHHIGGLKGKTADGLIEHFTKETVGKDDESNLMCNVSEHLAMNSYPEFIQDLITMVRSEGDNKVAQCWKILLTYDDEAHDFGVLNIVTVDDPETEQEIYEYANLSDPEMLESFRDRFVERMMSAMGLED